MAKLERLIKRVKGPALWESLCRKHIAKNVKDADDAGVEIATNGRVLEMLSAYQDVASEVQHPALTAMWAQVTGMDTRG